MFSKLTIYLLTAVLLCACGAQQNQCCKQQEAIRAKKGAVFNFTLPSDLAKGYQWVVFDTTVIKVISHTSLDNPNKTEAQDQERFALLGAKKGCWQVRFYYIRPFDPVPDTANSKKITQLIKVL